MFRVANIETRILAFILAIGVVTLACGPTDVVRDILSGLPTATPAGRSGRGFAFIWYVSVSGDDSNTCTFADDACLTIGGAVDKAEAEDARLDALHSDLERVEHTIHIGPGTFDQTTRTGSSSPTVSISNIISLVGAGSDKTFIEGRNVVSPVSLHGDAEVSIIDLTIQNGGGEAPGNCLTLRGNSAADLENVNIGNCSGRGIEHFSPGSLNLTNVMVSNSEEDGLLIRSTGDLGVVNSRFVNNGGYGIQAGDVSISILDTTVHNNDWGGLSLGGTVNLVGSVVTDNGAGELGSQAGLTMHAGTATISETLFSGHPHEGIVTAEPGSDITIQNSTVEGNAFTGIGVAGGNFIINAVLIRDNGRLFAETSIAGGIESYSGSLRIENSNIRANHNGGIRVADEVTLTVLNTTVNDNLSVLPGIWNSGTATIENSTISNNSDAGIENRGTMQVINSTISGNRDNGITAVDGDLTLSFVTIAGNGFNGLNAFTGSESVRSVSNTLVVNNANEDCEVSAGPGITHFSISGNNFDSDDTCLGMVPQQIFLSGRWPITAARRLPMRYLMAALRSTPPAAHAPLLTSAAPPDPLASAVMWEPMKSRLPSRSRPQWWETWKSQPTVNTSTLCWGGPGALYSVVSSATQGTQVELLGIGADEGWFIIVNPRFGIPCWIAAADLDVDPQLDVGALQEFPIPPVPTATPTVLAPPAAPSGLQANTTQCDGGGYKVTVIWNDEADNEEGYRVYRM